MAGRRQDPKTPFGWYLRRVMDARGFDTDEALAKASGVNASMISKWQAGTIVPTIPSLRRAAAALGVELRVLMVEAELVTPTEVGLSEDEPRPVPTRLERTVERILSLLNDDQIPEYAKDQLRRVVNSGVEFWYDQMAVPQEPTAAERAFGDKIRR